jgi:hypothetical protein
MRFIAVFVLILLVFLGACQGDKRVETVDNRPQTTPPAPPVVIPKKGSNTFPVTDYVPLNQWIPLERSLDTLGFYRGVIILPHFVHFKHDVVPITFKLKSRKSVAQVSFDIFGVDTGSKQPLFETTLTPFGEEDGWVLYIYLLDSKTLNTSKWPDELGARFFVKDGMGAVATFRYVQAEVVLSKIEPGRYVDERLVFPAQFTQIRSPGRYKIQCFLFDQDGQPIAQSVSRGELGETDNIDIIFDQAVIGAGLENAKVRDCVIKKINPPGVATTYGRVDENAYRF